MTLALRRGGTGYSARMFPLLLCLPPLALLVVVAVGACYYYCTSLLSDALIHWYSFPRLSCCVALCVVLLFVRCPPRIVHVAAGYYAATTVLNIPGIGIIGSPLHY